MKQMGISSDEMMEIFQVVAGVLHLGNIVFEDAGGSSGRIASHTWRFILLSIYLSFITSFPDIEMFYKGIFVSYTVQHNIPAAP